MGLKFDIWGFLPAYYRTIKGSWSHARGPFVSIADESDSSVLSHEQFHVKQWYVFFTAVATVWSFFFAAAFGFVSFVPPLYAGIGVLPLAALMWLWNSGWVRTRREHAAYGESLRHVPAGKAFEERLNWYARILHTAKSYAYTDDTIEGHRAAILRRFKDRRLF